MPFPWGQSTLPVTFTCRHCGKTEDVFGESVVVCSCKGAHDELAFQREEANARRKSQEASRKARMKEANKRRRKSAEK